MKTPDEIKRGLGVCNIWMVDEPNRCAECPYFCTLDCADTLMKNALAYIQQLEQRVPRWISVEERMPEDQRNMLTVNGHGLIRIMGLYHKHGDKWSWVHNERIKHYNDITHWMPLPEPPEEEA